MKDAFRNPWIAAPMTLGTTFLVASGAIAETTTALSQLENYGKEGQGQQAQAAVTSVSQLSDVQPTDWAFQALQSLVERYGCIAGYPDGTFKGNRAMTRYEFAAGLNACLDRVNELIAAATADLVTKEDLATLQKLQEKFAAELATLRGRVDAVEAKTAELEANQFSTTTKLFGEVVFGVSDSFGDQDDSQTVFQNRVRLNFVSSFPGDVQLNTRLDASNAETLGLPGGTKEGTFTYQTAPSGNTFGIGWIGLYFPIGKKIDVYVSPAFPLWQDFVPTVSPYLDAYTGATASLSGFAESNPIYKIGLGTGGAGFNLKFSKTLKASFGYFAGTANDPSEGNGLFNGEFTGLAQLTYTPSKQFQIAATYARSYEKNGSFFLDQGTSAANEGFGEFTADSVGVSVAYQFSPRFAMNAFGLYNAYNDVASDREADVWAWAVAANFPDLGKKGNLGSIIVGSEPFLSNDSADLVEDDFPLHIEALYRYQINKNISITPGVVVLTTPNGNDDNDTAVIGTVRTTFTF